MKVGELRGLGSSLGNRNFIPDDACDLESGFSGRFLSSRSSRLGLDSRRRSLAWSSHGCGKSNRLERGRLAAKKRIGVTSELASHFLDSESSFAGNKRSDVPSVLHVIGPTNEVATL